MSICLSLRERIASARGVAQHPYLDYGGENMLGKAVLNELVNIT